MGWTIAAVIAGVLLVWFILTNLLIDNVVAEIKYRDLPTELVGKRIVLLSDLHDKRFGSRDARLLKYIDKQSPDIVVFCGDMHNHGSKSTAFYAFAADLAKKYEVYCVEGNHELLCGGQAPADYDSYVAAMNECGVVRLDGKYADVFGGAARIYGKSYYNQQLPDMSDCGKFRILLSHDPSVFDIAEPQPELTVAGHIHGGFIEFPFLGAVFAPGDGAPLKERFSRKCMFPKYYKGVYRHGSSRLVVSRGLGNSVLPFRLIMPEIVTITLTNSKK